MKIRTYKELRVFQISFDLANQIFSISQQFPKEEKFGLIDQLHRVAVSIPSNISCPVE